MATILDITNAHRALYDERVAAGTVVPLVLPQGVIGVAAVIAFLMLPASSPLNTASVRYATFALAAANHVWVVLNCSSGTSPGGLMIGFMYTWGVFVFAYLLVLNDPKRDFWRVETRAHERLLQGQAKVDKKDAQSESSVALATGRQSNGNGTVLQNRSVLTTAKSQTTAAVDPKADYFWQPFPSHGTLLTRLDWAIDVLISQRGVGWNFQTSWLPSLPAFVQRRLLANDANPPHSPADIKDISVSRMGVARFDNRKVLLRTTIVRILVAYLIVDGAKTIMSHDRFFVGEFDAPAPAYFPPFIRNSWVLVRLYRTLLSGITLQWVMRAQHPAMPLIFSGLLGPDLLGPRGEAWHFPDHWGFVQHVGDNGIGGYWGGYWHQAFRVILQAHGHALLKALRIPKKSALGRYTVPIVVFLASGVVHALSSFTTIVPTHPWKPMLFFALQPAGIILEQAAYAALGTVRPLKRLPRPFKRACNILWLIFWVWLTGPLLVNDIALAGAWVTEPFFLFSPWRTLGLGIPSDRAFNGDFPARVVPKWHVDPLGRWWNNGLTL